MKPISVIIPVYNREDLVVRTLDSVYAQTYRPIELIVVDNNSTDSSAEVMKRWKESHHHSDFDIILINEQKPGAAIARQTGFTKATSEVVLFFDSDDIMRPELLTKVMEKFRTHPNTDMIYWQTSVLSTQGQANPKRFSTSNLLRRHLFNGMLCTISYAVKTDYFKKCGGWNPTLTGWDDWELGLRLLLNNPVMESIPEPLVIIYPQPESITGTDFKSKQGEWEKAIEAMERVSATQKEPLRSKLKRMLLYRRINLAALYKAEGASEIAKSLLEQSLSTSSVSTWRKWLLRLIYHYTSHGGRAAYLLWN
ncbi:MAG: glycosyltransferase family 2 protein [Muribaculaceae bacterium]|nr:glycosyltransferase family 2 protein [Muribaculaceae bacterium]